MKPLRKRIAWGCLLIAFVGWVGNAIQVVTAGIAQHSFWPDVDGPPFIYLFMGFYLLAVLIDHRTVLPWLVA